MSEKAPNNTGDVNEFPSVDPAVPPPEASKDPHVKSELFRYTLIKTSGAEVLVTSPAPSARELHRWIFSSALEIEQQKRDTEAAAKAAGYGEEESKRLVDLAAAVFMKVQAGFVFFPEAAVKVFGTAPGEVLISDIVSGWLADDEDDDDEEEDEPEPVVPQGKRRPKWAKG